MSFNSVEFLVFLIAVVGCYWFLGHRAQNLMLLGASYLFYGAWKKLFPESQITVLHHESQPPSMGYRSDEDASRGHTSWRDNVQLAIQLKRVRRLNNVNVEGHVARMRFTKVVTCADQEDMYLRMSEDNLLMEPKDRTARQYAAEYLARGAATRQSLVMYLTSLKTEAGEAVCGRTKAYELAAEMIENGRP